MIGIYDSGVGGLGIFKKVRSILPQESITYFADTAYFPFGDRSAEEVREIALQGLQHLATTCDLIVIACNTASVSDIEYFRANVSVPLIAVVPVIKTAANITDSKHIALLATTATASSAYTDDLIAQFAKGITVTKIGCPGLADAIEYNDTEQQSALVQSTLQNLGKIDVIVLGCTHYTLIKGLIQNIAGPDVKVIDSNTAVARHVLRVLRKANLERPSSQPQYIFSSSKTPDEFEARARAILQAV